MSARQVWGFYCFSTSASQWSQECPGATAAARPPEALQSSVALSTQGHGGLHKKITAPIWVWAQVLVLCPGTNHRCLDLVCWPQSLFCMETLQVLHNFLPLEWDLLCFRGCWPGLSWAASGTVTRETTVLASPWAAGGHVTHNLLQHLLSSAVPPNVHGHQSPCSFLR